MGEVDFVYYVYVEVLLLFFVVDVCEWLYVEDVDVVD